MRQLVAALSAMLIAVAVLIAVAPSTPAAIEKSQFGYLNSKGLGESCSGLLDVCKDPMHC